MHLAELNIYRYIMAVYLCQKQELEVTTGLRSNNVFYVQSNNVSVLLFRSHAVVASKCYCCFEVMLLLLRSAIVASKCCCCFEVLLLLRSTVVASKYCCCFEVLLLLRRATVASKITAHVPTFPYRRSC